MLQLCRRLAFLVALASSGLASAQPPANQPPPAAGAPAAVLPTARPDARRLAVWLGHVKSDNVARSVTPQDGAFDSVGLLLGLGRTSTRLDASIDADLEYRTYSLNTVDDETVGTLNASAAVDVVQDRFDWTFNESYGQGATDPFAGLGPNNRQKINIIGTGPRVTLPLGGRTSLGMDVTYSERRFEESSNVDSDSVVSELGLYRQTSSTARFGIVASSNDVEYVDVIAPEYRIARFGLRYEKELASGSVLADVGTNEISGAGGENDEPLYNFEWTRSLTARSELSIRAAREITDAGGVQGASPTNVIVTPNPLEQRRLGVSYLLTMSRTVVSADIEAWKDEYIGNAPYDNDSTTIRLSFARTISPRLSVGVDHNEVERDFMDQVGAQPDGEDSWTAAWLNRVLGRRFSVGFAVTSYERTGFDSSDEQRYELRFGYSPTDSGVAVAAMSSVGR